VLRCGMAEEGALVGRESQCLLGATHVCRAVAAAGNAGGGWLADLLQAVRIEYIYVTNTIET
jgi:hypothetical protein